MKRRPTRSLARGTLVLAALLVAIPTTADDSSPRTDPDTLWRTQEWPMAGQDNDQHRNITVNFTCARVGNTPASPPANAASHYTSLSEINPADPNLPDFIPQAYQGEAASAAVGGGILSISKHGIAAACVGGVVKIFANLATYATSQGVVSVINHGCGPTVGSPLLIPLDGPGEISLNTAGRMDVIYYAGGCRRITRQRLSFSKAQAPGGGGGPPINITTVTQVTDDDRDISESDTHFVGSPVLDNNVIYVATDRKHKNNVQGPGYLYALNRGSLEDNWKVPLQTGSGSQGPVPKGQEPPPASERFHATTSVAVRGDLAVVGCRKYDDRDDGVAGHALIAYATLDGRQRWVFRPDAQIMPNPVITESLVIFGTANGKAYVLTHNGIDASRDGQLRWATPAALRIRYQPRPFNESQALEDEALYGPAISQDGQYAYFGGSGGPVHRFDIQSGTSASSAPLLYFAEIDGQGRLTVDGNGASIIRPCRINSPPVVYKSRTLLVKCWTQNYGLIYNGAFLFAVRVPELTFNPEIDFAPTFSPPDRLDADAAEFVFNPTNRFGGVGVNHGLTPVPPGFGVPPFYFVMDFNPYHRVRYVLVPGWGFQLDNSWVPGGIFEDSGGVSVGSGFVMVTSRNGRFLSIPSADTFTPALTTGSLGPFPPPPPGPTPPLPGGLGPVEVFPNPFRPSSAAGGVAKFRNLPVGTVVELYTLAFERVRVLTPTNNLAVWNGRNEAGQDVATGVYLYRIVLPDNLPPITGRLALIR